MICGRLERDPDDHTRTSASNPKVLVEVLSPSTETYDRGEKLDNYKRIASLEEVVLIEQRERGIEIWRRAGDVWTRHEFKAGVAVLESIGCQLALDEVYRSRLPT